MTHDRETVRALGCFPWEKVAKALYASGVTQTEIGRRLGVHSATISRAVRGEPWGHVA